MLWRISMLNKVLICVVVLLTVIIGFGVYEKAKKTLPYPYDYVHAPPSALNQLNLETITVEPDPEPICIPKEVLEVNRINSQLKGMACSGINVYVWEGGFKFRLSGNLRYEKGKKFRMTVRSLFGKELDLGSNDEQFWFWSRRSNEPGLFYAKHEDYYKTRLKTPFNPVWIMHTLGIDEIDAEDVEIVDEKDKDEILVVKEGVNSMGKPILTTTFVNRYTMRVTKVLTTDLNGKPLASSEIKKYSGNFPIEIVYDWFEENKTMEIKIKGPWEGGKSNPLLWERPNINPKTDMGVD